jgi:hypothetical protein
MSMSLLGRCYLRRGLWIDVGRDSCVRTEGRTVIRVILVRDGESTLVLQSQIQKTVLSCEKKRGTTMDHTTEGSRFNDCLRNIQEK